MLRACISFKIAQSLHMGFVCDGILVWKAAQFQPMRVLKYE